MPGTRSPETGSASTGQPAASANASTVDGSTPAPQPASTTPRGGAADQVGERLDHRGRRCAHTRRARRPGTVVRATGRVDERRARGDQRLPERQVEVHRSRRRAERGVHRARRERPPRRADTVAVFRRAGIAVPAHRVAVELGLVHGLPRAGVAELGRAVGGAHDHRHAPVVCLEHRGMEVRGGRARRAEDDRRHPRRLRDPQRGERRRTLVEMHVDGDAIVARQCERERRRARPGRDGTRGRRPDAPTRRRVCGRTRWWRHDSCEDAPVDASGGCPIDG